MGPWVYEELFHFFPVLFLSVFKVGFFSIFFKLTDFSVLSIVLLGTFREFLILDMLFFSFSISL